MSEVWSYSYTATVSQSPLVNVLFPPSVTVPSNGPPVSPVCPSRTARWGVGGAAKHRVRQDKIVPLSLSVMHGPLRQRWAIRGPGWGPACVPASLQPNQSRSSSLNCLRPSCRRPKSPWVSLSFPRFISVTRTCFQPDFHMSDAPSPSCLIMLLTEKKENSYFIFLDVHPQIQAHKVAHRILRVPEQLGTALERERVTK